MKAWLTALAAGGLSLTAGVTANVANAATISIGWREDGGALTTVAGSGVSSNFEVTAPISTPDFTITSAGGQRGCPRFC